MELWMEYDSTILEWGLPEKTLERLMEERGFTGRIVGAGTDLQSGQRDVQIEIDAPLEDVADLMDTISADGIVSVRLREDDT
jgi:hypothetical protein